MHRQFSIRPFAFLLFFFIPACSGIKPVAADANVSEGCIQHFDPQKDYFPDKVHIQDAKNFVIEYHNSYKVITEYPKGTDGAAEIYLLVQCGAPTPALTGKLASAQVVHVPISTMYSAATTHQALLEDLDRIDVLTGIPERTFATDSRIIERVNAGKIVEFAPKSTVNSERVIAAAPSIMMVTDVDSPTYSVIRNAGVAVISNSEWLEQTALGRAEWMKFMAVFLNEEAKAEKHYAEIRANYVALAERTRSIPENQRPTVLTGGVFRGIYTISGGRSYVAGLISDAGGKYVWADNKDAGIANVEMEAQIARAGDADIWINTFEWPDLGAMLKDEPRYKEFKSFRDGQVWMYDLKMTKDGMNEYWSRGVTRPDWILADLIKIFHPDLAKDHEFEWYRQIPPAKQ